MSRAARRQSGARVGTVIAERFHLVEMLGEGGMAEVYRGTDGPGGRAVAVKLLHSHIASNDEAVERTKLEGELLSQLDNPAIVSVETFGQLEDGTVYLVMELLEGETLGDRMREGRMEPVELAPIVAGTCAGLHAAHRAGVVHRDLKPDNIFLCPTAHGLQVKLLDFGISKVSGNKLTKTGEVLGTPRYMSPEQLGAEHDVDARVDVYALGIILYEAIAGQPPFLSGTPTDLIISIINGKVTPLSAARPDVPPEVESVVMRALSCARAARYETAMGLAEAYVDAVGGVRAVRRVQKRGMATRAVGGTNKRTALPSTRPPPATDDAMRVGTFSGLAAVGSEHQTGQMVDRAAQAEPPAPRVSGKATMAMGAVVGGAVPEAPGPPQAVSSPVVEPRAAEPVAPRRRGPVPVTRETPLGMLDVDPPPSPRSVPQTAMLDLSVPGASPPGMSTAEGRSMPGAMPAPPVGPPLPTPRPAKSASGRGLLVVGALLAGAISAAAVIGGLKWIESSESGSDERAEPRPPVRPTALPSEPPRALPEVSPPDTASASDETPATAEPSEPTASQEPARSASGRRRVRRAAAAEANPPPPADAPTGARGVLRQAQQALQAGDASRCISLLDEAIRGGAPAISLRRRADCLEAAGRRQEAVRDYQRFCRLVPDNPAISDVRARLAGWGQTCP